jgi:hypothetical protein
MTYIFPVYGDKASILPHRPQNEFGPKNYFLPTPPSSAFYHRDRHQPSKY